VIGYFVQLLDESSISRKSGRSPSTPLPDAITGLDYLYAWRSTHYWRTKYQKKRDGIFINSLRILFKQLKNCLEEQVSNENKVKRNEYNSWFLRLM
jgi:hypothetical protein